MLTVGSLTDRMAESVHCRHLAIVKIKGDGADTKAWATTQVQLTGSEVKAFGLAQTVHDDL